MRILDVGSFNGEMFDRVAELLPEYILERHAVDVNADAMRNNNAEHTYIAPADALPLPDASMDVVITRYALQWNAPETQQRILKELARVARNGVIIEHAGAGMEDTPAWRRATDTLFRGDIVPALKRAAWYYSTRDEVERYGAEAGVHMERIGERAVPGLSEIFIKRYGLAGDDAGRVAATLSGHDYFVQTRWVIRK